MTTFAPPPLYEHEREALAPAEILPLSAWAERKRYVTAGPAVGPEGVPVPWSNALDPLVVTIMAAIDSEHWSRVCYMGSPQRSGKTEVAVNAILATIDQQRANVFYHNASAVAAMDVWKKKILPAIEHSPALAHLLSEDREEGGVKERRDFTNATSLFVRGSESRAALAQATAPLTIADDVQAMSPLPDGDHPADLGMERADAYPVDQRRHLHLGQPGIVSDHLAHELFGSTFYVPFVPCLGCGTYQMIEWDRFVYDDSDPESARDDCWMRCANEKCRHEIRDDDLPAMLAEHLWVSTPPETNWVVDPMPGGTRIDVNDAAVYPDTARKTLVCGFWRSAFYWPFVSWGELAVQAISAAGKPEETINFGKRIRAVPYEPPKVDEDALEPADVKAHTHAGHHWKAIPAAAGVHEDKGVLLVTGDVMAGYLWYLVLAWHLGTGSSWLIECGRFGKKIESTEIRSKAERTAAWKSRIARALEGLWTKDDGGWPVETAGGEVLETVSANHCLIDCGFLRETVQTACRRFNGGRWVGRWRAVEGSQARAASKTPVWPAKPTIETKTKRRYWVSNTNRGKLYVRDVLAIPPGNDGAFHLPTDMPAVLRDQFAKHICAEEWLADKGRWQKVSDSNHLLDCMALQIAGAISCDVRLPMIEQAAKRKRKRVSRSPVRTPDGRAFLVTER